MAAKSLIASTFQELPRSTDDFDFVYLRLLGVELEVAPDLD